MKSKLKAIKKVFALTLSAIIAVSSFSVISYADDDDDYESLVEFDDDETTDKKNEKKEKSSSKKEENEEYDDVLEMRGRYYEEETQPVTEEAIVITEAEDDYVRNREDYVYDDEYETEEETEKVTEKATEKETEKATEKETEKATIKETESETTTEGEIYWFNDSEPDVLEINLNITKGNSVNGAFYTSYLPTTYSWNSSDESIVKVNSNGNIVGADRGIATIYAVSENEVIIFTVSVSYDSSSSSSSGVRDRAITIYKNDRVDLSKYVSLPYYAYRWYSNNASIASVTEYGILRGEKVSDTVVYADADGVDNDYVFYVKVKESSSKSSSKNDYYDRKFTIYMDDKDSVSVSEYLEKDPSKYSWEVNDSKVAKVTKSSGTIKGVGYGNTTVRAIGSRDYYFNVKVGRYYDNCSIDIKADESFDLKKYLDDPSDYTYSYLDSSIAKVKDGKIVGLKKGVTYVVCDNKHSSEIVQVMVEVKGKAAGGSSSQAQQTTEKTTETTTVSNNGNVSSAQTGGFRDISHRAWAVSAINNMAAKGYINGRNAETFAPDESCSKADFTIVLTKMIGIEDKPYTGGFDDVDGDEYYAKYVNVAREYGLCAGVNNNRFNPKTAITREEIMYMVYKGLVYSGRTLDTDTAVLAVYGDALNVDDQYKEAVAALLNEGIVTGVSDTSLDPDANITRAQMAVLLNNLGF